MPVVVVVAVVVRMLQQQLPLPNGQATALSHQTVSRPSALRAAAGPVQTDLLVARPLLPEQ
jgi:hypothetical protein